MATPKFQTPITGPPLNILVTLFPGFQLLDVTGPLDMFNFLSGPPYNAPIRMVFVAETLESVGTKLVDREGSAWRFDIEGAMGKGEKVNEGFDQRFVVGRTFEDVAEKVRKGEERWDVVFVPGGVGSRVRRWTAGQEREAELAVKPLVEFVREVAPTLGLGIMTVCTGSDVLGWTGLIDGRRATTNMLRFEDVSGRHDKVGWVKGARWVKSPREEDRSRGVNAKGIEIWTSAGVSAGMDLALAFIAEKFGGMDVARDIARKSECE